MHLAFVVIATYLSITISNTAPKQVAKYSNIIIVDVVIDTLVQCPRCKSIDFIQYDLTQDIAYGSIMILAQHVVAGTNDQCYTHIA